MIMLVYCELMNGGLQFHHLNRQIRIDLLQSLQYRLQAPS